MAKQLAMAEAVWFLKFTRKKRENMVILIVNFYLKKEYPGMKNLATICLKDLVTESVTITQNQVVTIF